MAPVIVLVIINAMINNNNIKKIGILEESKESQ